MVHPDRVAAAVLDEPSFERLVGPLIPQLRLHCYRLVGTLDDAEDMVQEALLRAWLRRDALVDESGIRPWLYRIATNACLDLLDRRRRRRMQTVDSPDRGWLDPLPERWLDVPSDVGDPADGVVRRETVGFAFLTAVQLLPPRQRAMLLLRDVLEWSVPEVAEALETSPSAVNSALQRARATIRSRFPVDRPPAPDPAAGDAHDVALRYLEAWERGDSRALAELLTEDARMAMPPDPRVFAGRDAIVRYLDTMIFGRGPERSIHLAPTSANGDPAFIVIEQDPLEGAHAIGVKVLSLRRRRIAEIRGYMRADLAARFGERSPG